MIAVVRWPGITLTRYSGVRGYVHVHVHVVFRSLGRRFRVSSGTIVFPWLTDWKYNQVVSVCQLYSRKIFLVSVSYQQGLIQFPIF